MNYAKRYTKKMQDFIDWAKTLGDLPLYVVAVYLVGVACRRAEKTGNAAVATLCRRFIDDMSPTVGTPPSPEEQEPQI